MSIPLPSRALVKLAKLTKIVLLSLVAATGLITAFASPAHAVFYQVPNEAPDVWWSDARCSLREALYAIRWRVATADCPAGDAYWNEIEIVGEPQNDLVLTSTDPIEVNSFVRIYALEGPDFYQEIIGNQTIFKVLPGGTLELSALHFRNFTVPAFYIGSGVVPGYGFLRGQLWFNGGEMSRNYRQGTIFQTVGIWNAGGDVSLSGVKLHHNTGSIKGGAILNQGLLTISNSSLYGNYASQYGGAIHNVGSSDVNVSLFNVTISDNEAGISGGGIQLSAGTADLSWTTVTRNRSATGGGINVSAGTTFTTRKSIFSDNSGQDCAGTVTSANYNLFMNCANVSGGSGDVRWVSANLSPLTFPTLWWQTPYHEPLWNSPALNVIPVASCLDDDQIGNHRNTGASCDIGSIERL